MSEPCKRCEGLGYFIMVMKARSVGISTIYTPAGGKVTCPDCDGTGKAAGE
jgi:hypothetical protein